MDSGDDLGFFHCRVETRYSQPGSLFGRRLLVTARSTRKTQRPTASARMHHSAQPCFSTARDTYDGVLWRIGPLSESQIDW